MKSLLFIGILVIGLLVIPYTQQCDKVRRVIDGDTFEIDNGDIVRIARINTPELPTKEGFEAKDKTNELISGKCVILKGDSEQEDADSYGRIIRFVEIDGLDLGRELVNKGFAEFDNRRTNGH